MKFWKVEEDDKVPRIGWVLHTGVPRDCVRRFWGAKARMLWGGE